VFVESVEDARLESLEDHAVGTFDLTVSSWMSDRSPIDSDAVSIVEVLELLLGEVSLVVSDNTVRNAESIDDVEEEFDRLFRSEIGDGLGLYPFGKLVDCYE